MTNCREQDHIDAIRFLLAKQDGTDWRDVPLNDVNQVLAVVRLLKEEVATCGSCESTNGVTLGPNPYRHELFGDETPVWLCADCRFDLKMDT